MHAQPDSASSPPTWHAEHIRGFAALRWGNGNTVAKPPQLRVHRSPPQTTLHTPRRFSPESFGATGDHLPRPISSHARLRIRKSWLPLSGPYRSEDAGRDSEKRKSFLLWLHQSS